MYKLWSENLTTTIHSIVSTIIYRSIEIESTIIVSVSIIRMLFTNKIVHNKNKKKDRINIPHVYLNNITFLLSFIIVIYLKNFTRP